MAAKIGFVSNRSEDVNAAAPLETRKPRRAPRKSVVRVKFGECGMALSYYNDRFDLACGDMVYVEGTRQGNLGCVVEVNYNFKIKLSEYKRVVAVVDTEVHGRFYMEGAYCLSFDRKALPNEQVLSWFKAPMDEEVEYASSNDGSSYALEDLNAMNFNPTIAERGEDYCQSDRVKYLSLNGACGYAIVQGGSAYELEFEYRNGQISNLSCSCFCSFNCKHEMAMLLLLRRLLAQIEENHAEEYARSDYFAAVLTETLFSFAVAGKSGISFTL